jgi:hypothetical protein
MHVCYRTLTWELPQMVLDEAAHQGLDSESWHKDSIVQSLLIELPASTLWTILLTAYNHANAMCNPWYHATEFTAPTTSSKGVTYFLELFSKVLGVTSKDLMLLLSKGSGHWAGGLAWHTVSLFLALSYWRMSWMPAGSRLQSILILMFFLCEVHGSR